MSGNGENLEDYLQRVYFDPKNPASYGGVNRLRNSAISAGFKKASYGRVRKWLQEQDVYGLFRPARRKFPRNETPMYKRDWVWEGDLMDMTAYAADNDGYSYVLCLIDVFTRYAWTAPLKTKRAVEVAQALEGVFDQGRRPESALRTDMGGEFVNARVRKLLSEHGIKLITSFNETKAGMVERLIKTLKSKLMRHVYQRSNYRWIEALQSVTSAYNNARHRSLGLTPSEAVNRDDDELRLEQYLRKHPFESKSKKEEKDDKGAKKKKVPRRSGKRRRRTAKFTTGDTVRISYLTTPFTREYQERFSHELFKIKRAFRRDQLPVYQLEDWDGDPIDGTFYEPELTLAYPPKNDVFRIEKVLKKKGRGLNAQAYVKFYGWPKKFNAWVPAADVIDIVKK